MSGAPIPRDSDAPVVWAEYYTSLGWALSHFPPGTKGPKGKEWNTPSQWIDTPEKARAQWAATKTHGMGVIHAGSGTVAVDIDHIEHTRRVFVEFGLDIDKLLADVPRIRGKRTGRDKAIFRAPDHEVFDMHRAMWTNKADPLQNVTLFELRAGAVHDCLPPSQHPDGHRYEWRRAPWEFETLPTLPSDLLAFWREFPSLREQIAGLAPWADRVQVTVPAGPRAEGHNNVIGEFNKTYSVDAILRAHGYTRRGARYLAPSSTSKIPGVAILEDGRVYSHHGSDILADGHAHDVFDLFRILDHGGDFQQALREASDIIGIPVYGDRSDVDRVDVTALLGQAAVAAVPAAKGHPPRFPAHLLDVPGLLGQMTDYINRTARYPQPILALAAAIAAAGCLMGRKVRTESDLRTNVYVLAVAEAGAGKEHARQAVRTMFDYVGAFKRVSVEAVASDAAVNTALIAVPSSLFLLDEIGRLLSVLNDARAGSHLTEVTTQLLKLHSAASGPFCPKVYADPDRTQIIQQPCLCIYGTTVPGKLHEALNASQVEDGFLSRLMIFESENADPDPVDVQTDPPPQSLIDACAAWELMSESPQNDPTNVAHALKPHPRIVHPDANARMVLSRFETEMRERRRALRAANQPAALYVRTAATAQKLALIRAAGCDPDAPLITQADAEWACALALHLTDSMAWRILAHVAENTTERNVKRIGELVRRADGAGLTKSDITRQTQGLNRLQRDDALNTLTESGQIFAGYDEGTTKRAMRYWWHTHMPVVTEDPSNVSMEAA